MTILKIDGQGVALIIFLVALAWIIPIAMLIIGLVRLKRKQKNAKILLIISGIWLLIGLGFCGSLM